MSKSRSPKALDENRGGSSPAPGEHSAGKLTLLRRRIITLVLGLATLYGGVANAQQGDGLGVRVGIGTFLTHDRGWDYSVPIELLAAVTRKSGPMQLEAGASFSKSFVSFSQPLVFPPPPTGYTDGVRLRLGVRVPGPSQSPISALVGTELIRNQTEGESHALTLGGTVGVGLNFGPRGRGALDLKYVRFAKRLGSSRGILPLTLSWRL